MDAPEVVDDFELGQEDTVDIMDREVNKQKLRRRIEQFKVTIHVLPTEALRNFAFVFSLNAVL